MAEGAPADTPITAARDAEVIEQAGVGVRLRSGRRVPGQGRAQVTETRHGNDRMSRR
jgi:hypothetical protein